MNGISSGTKAIIAVDTCTTSWSTKGSSWDYARGIGNVVWTIADLLEEAFATEVVELSEYALAAVEGAMNYDVDGAIGGIIKDLEWAEEGAWVFPDGGHPDLRRFLADEYHGRGRHEEAMDLIWTGFAEETRLDGYEELKAHADRTGTWERWRRKALDFVREDIAREKKESESSDLSRPVDHSRLVKILLWEGNVEDAWREAKEGGCSDRLWLDLATRREEVYPEDSLAIYQERIEPLVNQTNNKAYRHAYELLLRVRELLRRLGWEAEFEEYVDLLSLEYRRKRNFIKLLDGME